MSALPTTTLEARATARPLRVLMVTGGYPTAQVPQRAPYIKSQVESLIAEGVEVEVIHPRPAPMPLRYAAAVTQVLIKSLSGRYDVVHGHYGLWCLVARLQWTTPVVASFLGTDLMGKPTADGRYSRRSLLVVRLSQWLSRHVDAVIVKSEQMRTMTSARAVFVVPNGVDFELFHPMPRADARAALGWDPQRYYILFGHDPHLPVKGFPLAEAAVERLRRRGVPVELVVASSLPQTDLVRYLNASNALILPSIAEGSPNIVKEAMACNVPVVAADVGDVAQVIGHTKGCFVCTRDPDVVATALEQALHHITPTTGRADIQHLECSAVARQIIAIYEQVLDAGTRRTRQYKAREARRVVPGAEEG